jgi:hypothetical protein
MSCWATVRYGPSVIRDLQLGVYGEDWRSLPGIVPSLEQLDFFSYSTLSAITGQVPADQPKVRELQDLLAQAQTATGRGSRTAELAALDAYLAAVAAGTVQTPPSLSPLSGQILNAMGRAAYPYNPYITVDYVGR